MKRVAMMIGMIVFVATGASASTCDELSYQRNSIYKQAGYCFKQARQIAIFGNANCQYDNWNDVPLSERDRADIAQILREERFNGCR